MLELTIICLQYSLLCYIYAALYFGGYSLLVGAELLELKLMKLTTSRTDQLSPNLTTANGECSGALSTLTFSCFSLYDANKLLTG